MDTVNKQRLDSLKRFSKNRQRLTLNRIYASETSVAAQYLSDGISKGATS
jgi:hypothetical protein